MKTTLALLLATALLAGCDQRGTPPTGSGSIGAGGGTGSTGQTGSKDTSKTGSGSAKDTTSAPAPTTYFDSAQIAGQPGQNALVPGAVREALFFLDADQSLHSLLSSDGSANGTGTFGRETVWDVRVTSRDSLGFSFLSRSTDVGLTDTSWVWIDSSGIVPVHVVFVRVYAISSATELRIATVPGAVLSVSVAAHSGIPPTGNIPVGWLPPLVAGSTTATLVKLGKNQTPANATTFGIYIPGGGTD